MPSIQITMPDGTDATHELTEEVITVGRVSDNAIQIEDASVSSHHGEFLQRGEGYVFKDIGSTNGSFFHGQQLTPDEEIELKHGEKVILGGIPVLYIAQAGLEVPPAPEQSEPDLEPAITSIAPADFSNASPFQKKGSEREPGYIPVMALGVVALLAAGAAIYFAVSMKAPF